MKITKGMISSLFKSKVAINGIWLYILQIFNTVIPLITLPYITRILGPSQFGTFSSALNLVSYFQVIVTYGFDLSGARKVAVAKDKQEVSEIYSKIFYSKMFLFFATFIIMLIFSSITNVSETQFISMMILYSMVLGLTIQQTWLFQGLEIMKYITVINVISRSASVIMIFIFVNDSDQVYLYNGLYSLTYLLNGIICVLIVKLKLKIAIKTVKISDIMAELKDGWYIFTTTAMSRIFSSIGITVLVFTTTKSTVGIYSAIQKIPMMLIMIYAPIGQVFFPYVSKHYSKSFESGINVVKKLSKFVLPSLFIVSLLMILGSKTLISVLYGKEYAVHSILLIPLIIWMSLSIINNLLGIQVLVASGHTKEYSLAFRIGVISILLYNFGLGVLGGISGVAISAMLAELTLTFAIIYQIKKVRTQLLHHNESQKELDIG